MPASVDYPGHILYDRKLTKWYIRIGNENVTIWNPIPESHVEILIPKKCRMWVLVL